MQKAAEPFEMPFRMRTWVGPRKHVFDGGAQWRHLTNTIEPSVCGVDAAFGLITLTTCSHVRGVVHSTGSQSAR